MRKRQYRRIFHQMLAYFNYYIFAQHKKGYGIHSPFVYNLIKDVLIPARKRRNNKKWIEKIRKSAFQNQRKTEATSQGAGSHFASKGMIRIGKLAKQSTIPLKYHYLLVGILEHIQAKSILELGSCCGLTSAILAKGNPASNIYTVEGAQNRFDIAKSFFNSEKITNIEPICDDFDAAIEQFKQNQVQFDAVFVDGNHQYESTIRYFNRLLPIMKNEGLMVFDDIYWSAGMTRAWKRIKQTNENIVTIDLYKMGLVFIGRQQAKEHFRIKF